MPTGIYDRIKSKPNAGIFKKGEHRSPVTEFHKGQHPSIATEFKPSIGSVLCFIERNCATNEWREKQSNSHKGQHSSPNTEIKRGQRLSPQTEFKFGEPQLYNPLGSNRLELSGEKHPNWKGGITKESHLLRGNGEYHEWRIKVFRRDYFTCQKCGQIGKNLNAHHIYSFANHPELRYDINNGITLCAECHDKIRCIKGVV